MSLTSFQRALVGVDCDVAFDNLTRQLYATDASIYQIEPCAVAFPRDASQASSVFKAAAEAGVPIVPRGAGTGLVGGAIGEGLIVDLARHSQQITELNLDQRTVRAGAGVVLDQLNAFLKPHGLCFGPDVATSSRAAIGGMIANNSSGARVPVYGTTADHVVSLECMFAGGQVETLKAGRNLSAPRRLSCAKLVASHANEIERRMPPGLLKRWPGYALDRFLRQPDDLGRLLCGSEGTLGAILSAELNVVPLPREKGLALIFFASVAEAMQATVELLDLKPAAIEHIDQVLLGQTRGQRQFQAARDLLELETRPCESILVIELYDNVADRLEAVTRRRLGVRTLTLRGATEMNLVWALRKAGLSLLTGRKGPAKPVTCIEDAAIRPEQLPAYVKAVQSIMKPLKIDVCYYGHAAAGLLHVRPVLDLHTAEGVQHMRQISEQVSALVKEFKGSLTGEHGVGIARTEFLLDQLGPQMMEVMRSIKRVFDPGNLLNPGKIVDDGRYKVDSNLRLGAGSHLELPFTPLLAFADKDGSFAANLEQCNGCGGCRKAAPTMCPTFAATGDEIMSTRGRANAIRAVLELRGIEEGDPLRAAELEEALSNCLSCKACAVECPSNVDMSLLKAELTHARHQRAGLTLRERLLSEVDLLGKLGCLAPTLANAALEFTPLRRLLSKTLGISTSRPLPRYAMQRFDAWFAKHPQPKSPPRGPVLLWDDTFVRYHEPHIGIAAVRVLEAAGFEVRLLRDRRCCGRPALSQGRIDVAARLGRHNLDLLQGKRGGSTPHADSETPIIFLEPSCHSMFVDDYRELNIAGADDTARRCILFEQFIDALLTREPDAIAFAPNSRPVAIHAHCHAKALADPGYMARLARQIPGANVTLLDSGCCGMAGAFGMLEAKLALSLKVADPLVRQIHDQPADGVVVASGTSCRHQVEHLARVHPLHMAELLAAALP